jgi:hypothetical protein
VDRVLGICISVTTSGPKLGIWELLRMRDEKLAQMRKEEQHPAEDAAP